MQMPQMCVERVHGSGVAFSDSARGCGKSDWHKPVAIACAVFQRSGGGATERKDRDSWRVLISPTKRCVAMRGRGYCFARGRLRYCSGAASMPVSNCGVGCHPHSRLGRAGLVCRKSHPEGGPDSTCEHGFPISNHVLNGIASRFGSPLCSQGACGDGVADQFRRCRR